MKIKTKSTLFFLASLLTLTAVSCGGTDTQTDAQTTAADSGAPAVTETTAVPRIEAELPDADFEGYEFRVITRGQSNSHWDSKDIFAEAENGDLINDAVYKRNTTAGERYNFKVVEIGEPDSITGLVRTTVQAGEDAYDMASASIIASIATLAPAGMLVDLKTVPHMDLSKPWYDRNAVASLSVCDTLHAVTGDLTITDKDATWVVLFNKQMAANYDFDSLYDMVDGGTWTVDRMIEMCQTVSSDLNGDGKMDENDRWGVIGEAFNIFAVIVGSGQQYVSKDKDDIPYFTLEGESIYNAFEKALALTADDSICAYVNDFSAKFPNDVWGECMDPMFSGGRALFTMSGMNRVTLFRSMEADFGILPIPKYDEAQKDYYCPISLWGANSISVPKTATDLARTSHIIEALSAESLYTLTPAYYDQTLKTKAARDEESAAMLDIIFANRVYDLACMYDFGGIFSAINGLCDAKDPVFASTVQKKLPAAQKALDKIVAFYQEQE